MHPERIRNGIDQEEFNREYERLLKLEGKIEKKTIREMMQKKFGINYQCFWEHHLNYKYYLI